MIGRLTLVVGASLGVVLPARAQPAATAPRIPLREGLAVVRAYRNTSGDFEAIATVTHVDAKGVTIAASSDETTDTCGTRGGVRSAGLRVVLRADLESAHAFRQEFAACAAAPEVHPGETAIGVSTAVLNDLRTAGKSNLSATTTVAGMVAGALTRIEQGTVPLTIVVNDEPVALPAVHVRWQSSVGAREYWILDDPANPLVLRGTYNGTPFVQVVKLSYPGERTASARIERALSNSGRAVVYGIFFDFGSDRLKDESNGTLNEIARVLEQNPAWSLSVEGHTDNLGGDAYNLDLSKRRAAAVAQALAARYHVDAKRLKASGVGAARPRDTNDTLEGRARNRRVELVKGG